MIAWKNHIGLIAGLALIVLSNAIALALIYYNRMGEPDARLTLSQRELRLPYYFSRLDRENSGIVFKLNWRVSGQKAEYANYWSTPEWLNESKLRELGFDTNIVSDERHAYRRYRRMLPREAYVVLEYNGPVYQTRLKQLEEEYQAQLKLAEEHPNDKQHAIQATRAKTSLENEQNKFSRLFAIDAGVDKSALRNKYPNRSMYLITTGEIRIQYTRTVRDKRAHLTGRIQRMNIEAITSPYRIRKKLEGYLGTKAYQKRKQLKYDVVVAYGKRLEPWVENLNIIP